MENEQIVIVFQADSNLDYIILTVLFMTRQRNRKQPRLSNIFPLISSIKQLKKTVGLQDSCIQTNQLAILLLQSKVKSQTDEIQYLKGLFDTHKISQGSIDFDYLQEIQSKIYLLQTYNLIEPLIKAINKELRLLNNFQGSWLYKDDTKNLDPLNQLVCNFNSAQRKTILQYPEYHLLNYYRLIRNSIVHLQESDSEDKKTLAYYNQYIKPNLSYFHINYNIKAPNHPKNISYSDFEIYTRAIKYFGNIINDLYFPTLSNLVNIAIQDETLQNELLGSRLLNDDSILLRRINTLRRYFHIKFGTEHKSLRDDFCRAYLDKEQTDYSQYL